MSMPMDFMAAKSCSHSAGPQFWWGMSWEISSRKVPVMRKGVLAGVSFVDYPNSPVAARKKTSQG